MNSENNSVKGMVCVILAWVFGFSVSAPAHATSEDQNRCGEYSALSLSENAALGLRSAYYVANREGKMIAHLVGFEKPSIRDKAEEVLTTQRLQNAEFDILDNEPLRIRWFCGLNVVHTTTHQQIAVPLSSDVDDVSMPAWSPDGRHLAYLARRGSSVELEIFSVTNRQTTRGVGYNVNRFVQGEYSRVYPESGNYEYSPYVPYHWTADSRRIVYLGSEDSSVLGAIDYFLLRKPIVLDSKDGRWPQVDTGPRDFVKNNLYSGDLVSLSVGAQQPVILAERLSVEGLKLSSVDPGLGLLFGQRGTSLLDLEKPLGRNVTSIRISLRRRGSTWHGPGRSVVWSEQGGAFFLLA